MARRCGTRVGAAAFVLSVSLAGPQSMGVASADAPDTGGTAVSTGDARAGAVQAGRSGRGAARAAAGVSRGAPARQPAPAEATDNTEDSVVSGVADSPGVDVALEIVDVPVREPRVILDLVEDAADNSDPAVDPAVDSGVDPVDLPGRGGTPRGTGLPQDGSYDGNAVWAFDALGVVAPVALADAGTDQSTAQSAAGADVEESMARLNTAVLGFFDSVSRLLSSLPANPFSDVLSGALLLVRRTLFNQLPSASPTPLVTNAAGQWTGSLGATDPEGDQIVYRVVEAPRYGTVELGAQGEVLYTPGPQYPGRDDFLVGVSDAGFNVLNPLSSRAIEVAVAVPTPSRPAPVIAVQPDDQGQALISLLGAATRSIDIVIYQINDQGIEDALLDRMATGVNVRLMMDAFNYGNFTTNSTFVKNLRSGMVSRGISADRLQAHWSSDNFNITHQKSVIIDAVDATGQPLSPDGLPDSARVLISSGNFATDKYGPFWGSRNFYVTLAEPTIVSETARVFVSDFNCDGRTVTNDLAKSSDLVWSNGSTNVYIGEKGLYPKDGNYPFGTPIPPDVSVIPQDEGNVVAYQVGLIEQARAGDLLRIYTLEFVSDAISDALDRAAQRGVDVRLVTTYETKPQKVSNLTALAQAGATITYYAPEKKVPGVLYIHAKAMLLSDPQGNFVGGFVGSQNFSKESMTYNRELGIPLTPAYADVAAKIGQMFDADFAFRKWYLPGLPYTAQLTKDNPSTVPATWLGPVTEDEDDPFVRPGCGCVAEASALL